MQPTQLTTTYNIQGGNTAAFVSTQLYSSAKAETRNADMPIFY